jgi:hypothetical protein
MGQGVVFPISPSWPFAFSEDAIEPCGLPASPRTRRFIVRRTLLLLVPTVPPLLATGMPGSDYRALGRAPAHGSSNYGTLCRTASFRVGTLLLLRGWRLLWGWGLLRRSL